MVNTKSCKKESVMTEPGTPVPSTPGYAAVITADTIIISKDEKLFIRELSQSRHLFDTLKSAIIHEESYEDVQSILSAYGP
jgi:hypothetical protein